MVPSFEHDFFVLNTSSQFDYQWSWLSVEDLKRILKGSSKQFDLWFIHHHLKQEKKRWKVKGVDEKGRQLKVRNVKIRRKQSLRLQRTKCILAMNLRESPYFVLSRRSLLAKRWKPLFLSVMTVETDTIVSARLNSKLPERLAHLVQDTGSGT